MRDRRKWTVAAIMCTFVVCLVLSAMIIVDHAESLPANEAPPTTRVDNICDVKLEEQIDFYEKILMKLFDRIPTTTFSIPVTVTAYSAIPEETNSEPWFTADMSPSRVGMLAVSRDLLNEVGLEYGQSVIIEGIGLFKVHDTMNKRFKRRVDILMAHPKAALMFGKQEKILTWVKSQPVG